LTDPLDTDWLEVTALAPKNAVEAIEDWMFNAGALSVTLRDGEDDDDIAHAVLEPVPGAMLGDKEWERAWMDDFAPMQFGERLWICPTQQAAPDPSAITVRLDPGLAFGTGTHATTAQCLAWMGEKTSQTLDPIDGKQVVDFGCGSGVLAIAALLLGAEKAWAVDIDDQAVLATGINAKRNGVASQIVVGKPDILVDIQVDILFANILYKPLMALADELAGRVSSGGALVLSGILEEQIESLCLRYNSNFEFGPSSVQDGWALLSAVRR